MGMADDKDSPNLNGCPSNLEFSNASAADVSSNSISRFWSLAQNLTRSVFTRSGSQPAPASTTHPRKDKPIRSFEGYVSNDEDDFEGLRDEQPVTRRNLNIRITDGASESVPLVVNKRPFLPAAEESVVFSAAKRAKVDEQSTAPKSELSSTFRSRRFWTSDNSVSRPLHRPASISTSRHLQMSFLDKVQSHQDTPTNLFSVATRALSRPLSAASTVSGTASLSSISAISEINRKTAARNSETKRILLDLERVGGLPTPDSKRPRLWFQSISEETPLPRLSEKKRTPFGPPTTSLRTTDRAQVLPAVITPIVEPSLHRTMRNEQAPPILPAAVKRAATGETGGQYTSQQSDNTLFGKQALPTACKFTFSKPLPALSMATDKTVSSIPDISRSKMVPSSTAQAVSSAGSSFQFSKVTSVSAATSKNDSRPLNSTETSRPWNVTDKITFEDYKKAAKWKCTSCHFNNNPDDTSCRQCFCARSSVERGNLTIGKEAQEKTWRCTKCQLDNADSVKCCNSCQAPKTGEKLGNAEAASSGAKWSCSTCFVSNDGSANECVCCKTARTVTQAVPATVTIGTTATKWSCSECFISNDGSANECVCCKAAKPKKEAKSTSSDSWWCGTCSIKNDTTVSKCVACGSERIQPAKQSVKLASEGSTITPLLDSKPKWSCSNCFVGNDASINECVCCKTARPNQATPAKPVAAVPVQPAAAMKPEAAEKKSSSWSCTTCFLSNTADRLKCITCQSPKPGAAFKPVRLGASLFGSVAGTGVISSTPSTAFPTKFGIASELPAKKPETGGVIASVPSSTSFPAKFGFPSELPAKKPDIATSQTNGSTDSAKNGSADVAQNGNVDGSTTLSAPKFPSFSSSSVFGLDKPNGEKTKSTLFGSVAGTGIISNVPSTSFPAKFGIASELPPKKAEITTTGSTTNGGADGTTTSSAVKFPSFSSSSTFGLDKTNGDKTKTTATAIAFPTLPTTNLFNVEKSINGSEPLPALAFPSLPVSSVPAPAAQTTLSGGSLFQFSKTTSTPATAAKTDSQPLDAKEKPSGMWNFADKSTVGASLFGSVAGTGVTSGNAPTSTFPTSFGITSDQAAKKSDFATMHANGGTDGTTTSSTLQFPSFTGPSPFSLDKANGDGAKSTATIAFPSLPTANLFNLDKSSNRSASSPSLAAFPSLPVSSNLFSVTQTSAASPISGRRQLVAKRKAKRM